MSLSRCCQLFGISRQAIYQSINRAGKRSNEAALILSLVRSIRMEMPRLGTRKLYYLLREDFSRLNLKIGRDTFFRILRSENMLISPRKSYTKTTNSKHWLKKHPNLLKQLEIKNAEQVFVSDITYIKTQERTCYLSLVTDAYSRKIMGYQVSEDLSAESVVKALKMATRKKKKQIQVIHHSDRGLQYCSDIYQKVLRSNNMIASMTDGYDCYQNALAERMNGILKQEFLIDKCKDLKQLRKMVGQSVIIYNNKRPHLSLNYKTPNFIHQKSSEASLTGSYN